jgi:hypothetical protein
MSSIQWNLQVNAVLAVKPTNFCLFIAEHFKVLWKYTKEMPLLNNGCKELRSCHNFSSSFEVAANQAFRSHCFYVFLLCIKQESVSAISVQQWDNNSTCQTSLPRRQTLPTHATAIAPHQPIYHHITYRAYKILSLILYTVNTRYRMLFRHLWVNIEIREQENFT